MSLTAPAIATSTILGAAPPPAGVTPDFKYDNAYERGLIVYMSFLVAIVTSTTAMRAFTKLFLVKAHGWEDFFMYLGWAFTIVDIAFIILAMNSGAGQHIWNVRASDIVPFGQTATIAESIYEPSVLFVKLAILLQLNTIFAVGNNKRSNIIRIMLLINVLFYIATFISTVCQCIPMAKIWNPTLPGTCISTETLIITVGAFNVVSDVGMLILPVIWVWKIHMPVYRRLGVSAIFSMGLVCVVCSTLRLIYSVLNLNSRDITFSLLQVGLSSAGELGGGIFVGNMVLFPRFCRTGYEKVRSILDSLEGKRWSSEDASDRKSSRRHGNGWTKQVDAEAVELRGHAEGTSMRQRTGSQPKADALEPALQV